MLVSGGAVTDDHFEIRSRKDYRCESLRLSVVARKSAFHPKSLLKNHTHTPWRQLDHVTDPAPITG